MTGKGHTQRPYDPQKFGESFDRIFGKKETCSYPFCDCGLPSKREPITVIRCAKGLPWKKEEKK